MTLIFNEKYVEPQRHHLWVTDHEPTDLKHIVGNQMVVETLQSFLDSDRFPNLLLCGPNGCGKTTVAKIMVRNYLGEKNMKYHMEIIGSIYRGKTVVSEKNDKKKMTECSADNPNIINFIRKKASLPEGKCRIVTIYDFDCMTSEAQMALRRIIEIYSQKVRFIFICNDLNNIIEAIQSRALILKFHLIPIDELIQRLKEIATERHLPLCDEIFQDIGIIANGDLKQAINYLQVFAYSQGHTLDDFYRIFNIPSVKTLCNLLASCSAGKTHDAYEILNKMIENGYNVSDILDTLIKVLIHNHTITEAERALMIEETIKIVRINEESSSIIHLYKLVGTLGRNLRFPP